MTDGERAIHDPMATWMKASQAGDTAAVLSPTTDDVVFHVPGREPFGKEVFAAMSGLHARHPRRQNGRWLLARDADLVTKVNDGA